MAHNDDRRQHLQHLQTAANSSSQRRGSFLLRRQQRRATSSFTSSSDDAQQLDASSSDRRPAAPLLLLDATTDSTVAAATCNNNTHSSNNVDDNKHHGSNQNQNVTLFRNGWTLAIKKLNDWENLEDEFFSEITTLGGLRHRNLLPLIGFCADKQERFLVYKYMSNGSLDEWLHSNEDKAKILDFPLRAKIALGIAKGLAWLHHGYELHVTHGGISTRCILLDQNFEPKISNFWEAKFWSKNDLH